VHDFEYQRPKTLEEAATLLKAPDAKLLAGGMSLLPTIKLRLARYNALVDLGKLDNFSGIRREDDTLVIRALTRHATVAASDVVRNSIPALNVLAGGIGDPLVRNRGTIGGSIANADPAADYPSSVLGLDATIVTDRRSIAGDAFFTGLFETALEPGEIITAVHFPIPKRAGYAKFPNPASRFAIVGVFVAATAAGVRVAVTGAGDSVFRLTQAEEALSRNFSPSALDDIEVSPDGLNSDIHTSAKYRAHAILVMAKRAVRSAIES
jgi:carbon-monoxide dehydrogenase medium subunit